MSPQTSLARAVAAALLGASLLAASLPTDSPSLADEAHGPRFGNGTLSSEIRHVEGEVDVDVFTESLATGETLEVRVAAAKGSPLVPLVAIHGPDGQPRSFELKAKKNGQSIRTARVPVDETGTWIVRVSGEQGTAGGYTASFKIGKAKALTVKDVVVPAPSKQTFIQPFGAVEGAVTKIKVVSARGAPVAQFLRVLDPGGGSVLGSETDIRAKQRSATISGLELRDGDGAYGVLLASPQGPTTVSIKVKSRPPTARRRGRFTIDADEPFLAPLSEPLEGEAGRAVDLTGKRFPESPLPEVWFGALRGSVVGVRSGGTRISVVPPTHAAGSVVAVEVVTAEGQSTRREAHFGYAEPDEPPPPPAALKVSALSPSTLSIDGNKTQAFEVMLSADAPQGGVYVSLATTNGIGQVAPSIRVPTARRSATFLFGAADVSRTGEVRATLGTSSASAAVTVTTSVIVDPPTGDVVDLSGWSIAQAGSARTFTIPSDTELAPGEYLVLARNCTRTQFESFWGVTLGSNVIFMSSVDHQVTEVPTINGSETYQLSDAFGNVIDGPTIAMSSTTKQNLQRMPGTPAGSSASWSVWSNEPLQGNPGSGISAAAANNGIYISEFSDASGAGNYVFEFVELYYDGPPE